MSCLKWINLLGAVVLVLLLRKLAWCLWWLWCYYHGRDLPRPISLLPSRTGELFERHIDKTRDEEDDEHGTLE